MSLRSLRGVRVSAFLGPTNSGKTHRALEVLRGEGEGGVYAAPLRLLAAEVASSLGCSLVTGETRSAVHSSPLTSCTVEMLSSSHISHPVRTLVLDEVQLMSDASRGWAWTSALLNPPSLLSHLVVCGSMSALPLLRTLAPHLELHSFPRISSLRVASSPTPLHSIRPGDALVTFSRASLFKLRSLVRPPVCVVYGALPPEQRQAQASTFNEGAHALVATDAIGLGLNLRIKRVVFAAIDKYTLLEDGKSKGRRKLLPAEVQQIAGRAGRGDSSGIVSALSGHHLDFIREQMAQELPSVTHAGVSADYSQLEHLQMRHDTSCLPELYRLFEKQYVQDAEHFRLCDMADEKRLALLLHERFEDEHMPLEWHFTYARAPVDTKNAMLTKFLMHYAAQDCTQERVYLDVELRPMPRKLSEEAAERRLRMLEDLFSVCSLYSWLAMRRDSYTEAERSERIKPQILTQIGQLLEFMPTKHKKKKSGRRGRFGRFRR